MLKDIGFKTMLVSLPDYDNLVAEIYYNGLFFALISQERGFGIFDIEVPSQYPIEANLIRKVELNSFLEITKTACERLIGKRK